MVTVGQAGRIPVSLSLLLNHATILNYLQLWDFWRQTSGEKQMGLWVLMLKVKTTKNNAEPLDVCCYCAVIVVSFTVCPCVFVCTGLGPFSNILYNSYNLECFFCQTYSICTALISAGLARKQNMLLCCCPDMYSPGLSDNQSTLIYVLNAVLFVFQLFK